MSIQSLVLKVHFNLEPDNSQTYPAKNRILYLALLLLL